MDFDCNPKSNRFCLKYGDNRTKLLILRYIAFYSTAQTSDSAYVIGGQGTKNIVARYNTDNLPTWKKLGDLKRGRYGHGSIVVENKIVVFGGWANDDGNERLFTHLKRSSNIQHFW